MTATNYVPPFRPFRDKSEALRMAELIAHDLVRVMTQDGSREAAGNIVQALMDGECVAVFRLALDVLSSSTRAAALTTTVERSLHVAAAEIAIDYADAMSTWPDGLHRWAVLTQVVGIPEELIRAIELERRAARGEVAA